MEIAGFDITTLEGIGELLVWVVHHFGYLGIFVASFLESTFIPIPSEVTMIPAGVLVQQGHMNFWLVIISSTLGALGGSLFNYYLAYHFGRKFFYAYGKYFFFTHEKIDKLDKFFASHGDVSTFTGRLIPGLRHFIAFPAGLAHMDLKKFCFYTALGSCIWMTTLTVVGYLIGDNKALLKRYMPYIVGFFVVSTISGLGFYMWRKYRKNKCSKKEVGSETI
ncbi:MAG: DedA family protein [Rickettsiales bacterium]